MQEGSSRRWNVSRASSVPAGNTSNGSAGTEKTRGAAWTPVLVSGTVSGACAARIPQPHLFLAHARTHFYARAPRTKRTAPSPSVLAPLASFGALPAQLRSRRTRSVSCARWKPFPRRSCRGCDRKRSRSWSEADTRDRRARTRQFGFSARPSTSRKRVAIGSDYGRDARFDQRYRGTDARGRSDRKRMRSRSSIAEVRPAFPLLSRRDRFRREASLAGRQVPRVRAHAEVAVATELLVRRPRVCIVQITTEPDPSATRREWCLDPPLQRRLSAPTGLAGLPGPGWQASRGPGADERWQNRSRPSDRPEP